MAVFSIQNGESAVGTALDDIFEITEDLVLAATINGGAGTDTVDAQFARTIGPNVTFISVENLALDAEILRISASDFVPFSRIVADGGATTGNISFSAGGAFAFTEVSDLQTLNVTGSTGDDSLQFVTVGATVTDVNFSGGLGADDIVTGAGDDRLDGGSGADDLNAGAGNDTLVVGAADDANGGEGDDRFEVSENLFIAATLDGGLGVDTFDFQASGEIGAAVTITGIENLALDASALTLTAAQLNSFTRIVADSGAATGELVLGLGGLAVLEVTELATLNVTGSNGNDSLVFTTAGGVVTDVTVNAGAGFDAVDGGGGDDTLNGGDNDDSLDGNGGADVLNGDGGNDTLVVRDGDTANGGDGDDTFQIVGDLTAPVTLNGGIGTDTFDAQDAVTLGAGVTLFNFQNLALDSALLTLTGTQLDAFSTLVADSGATAGALRLSQGGTVNVGVLGLTELAITGSGQADDLDLDAFGTTTADITVNAGGGADVIEAGDGDDTLRGAGGGDELIGGSGSDLLEGGGGADELSGGGNGDELRGGAGNDELRGGGGVDTFVFATQGGADNVLDFVDGTDLLSFRDFGGGFNTAGEIIDAADQVGGNIVITLPNFGPAPGNTVVTLIGFSLADLDGSDFGPIVA